MERCIERSEQNPQVFQEKLARVIDNEGVGNLAPKILNKLAIVIRHYKQEHLHR